MRETALALRPQGMSWMSALGAAVLCVALGGCSSASGPKVASNPSTSTTSPTPVQLWSAIGDTAHGPFVGKVVPLGATTSLVATTDGLDQTVTASISRIFDAAAPVVSAASAAASATPTYPPAEAKWVGIEISVTNDGPQILGDVGAKYGPSLDLFVNGYLYGGAGIGALAIDYSIGGCKSISFLPVPSGATASGCIAVQVPTRASIRTVGLALYAAGAGVSPSNLVGALASWQNTTT